MYSTIAALLCLASLASAAAAAVPIVAELGSGSYKDCVNNFNTHGMAKIVSCKFFSSDAWYVSAFDKTWLNAVMGSGAMTMSCLKYSSTCNADNSIGTSFNFGMNSPLNISYSAPDVNGQFVSTDQDKSTMFVVLDTDYDNYGVILGCNAAVGSFWQVLTRQAVAANGLAWQMAKNKIAQVNVQNNNNYWDLSDANSTTQDNTACNGNPNGAATLTVSSGLVLSMLAVLSSYLMS